LVVSQLRSLVQRSGKRKRFSMKTRFIEKLNLLRHFYGPVQLIGSEKRQRKTLFKENNMH